VTDAELAAQAARVLYRLWWQEADSSTEAQKLEIHRLAIGGKEPHISVEVGDFLANKYRNDFRFKKSLKISLETLKVTQSHKLLYRLARAQEGLGMLQAINTYTEALSVCPADNLDDYCEIVAAGTALHLRKGPIEDTEVVEELIKHNFAANYRILSKIDKKPIVEAYAFTLTSELVASVQMRKQDYASAIGTLKNCVEMYSKHIDYLDCWESLNINGSDSNFNSRGRVLGFLAKAYLKINDLENAHAALVKAKDDFIKGGDRYSMATAIATIGYIYWRQGRKEQALVKLLKAKEELESLCALSQDFYLSKNKLLEVEKEIQELKSQILDMSAGSKSLPSTSNP
jgi:tetratricopeptide (TPR) repeat protein